MQTTETRQTLLAEHDLLVPAESLVILYKSKVCN